MKFGLDVATTGEWADIRLLIDLAVDAEAAGWDGFFVWDVFLTDDDTPVADPWIALAAIAARTERIKIGAMVTPLIRRQPWEVARQTAALDHLSSGRLVFGRVWARVIENSRGWVCPSTCASVHPRWRRAWPSSIGCGQANR